MRICILVGMAILAGACADRSAPNDARRLHVDTAAAGPPSSFALLAVDSTLVRSLPTRGSLIEARRWRDALGTHTLLLTQTGAFPSANPEIEESEDRYFDAELHAYDYVEGRGSYRLLWRTSDFERLCEFDLFAGFVRESLSITDLDADGVAEVTFQYTLSCRSDVSPATRKLILREGEAKYAIRGTTDLAKKTGLPEYGGGNRRIDPAFGRASPELRAFALEQWDRFVAQDNFEQF